MPWNESEAQADERFSATGSSRRARRAPWYAVQVTVGREERACELIQQAVEHERRMRAGFVSAEGAGETSETDGAEELLRACFVPKACVGVKREGKWVSGEEVLLPGYLIAATRYPERLAQSLHRIDGFARIVRQDNAFVPLSESDARWIAAQTRCGERAVRMSEGYVENGTLHVTSGPLLGKEAQVVKVSHRRKVAYLELEMFGRKITAQMGIKITRNKTCKKKSKKE